MGEKFDVFVVVISVVLLAVGFVGIFFICTGDRSKDEISDPMDSRIEFYVDPETKVEYVIFQNGYHSGICPRYNQDGSLYIWYPRED